MSSCEVPDISSFVHSVLLLEQAVVQISLFFLGKDCTLLSFSGTAFVIIRSRLRTSLQSLGYSA